MDLELNDRVALVCGGTTGIGLATARALAAEGAHVILTGHNPDRLREAETTITGARGIEVDVMQDHAAAQLYAQASDVHGRIDILILNGPGPAPGPASQLQPTQLSQGLHTLASFQIELANLCIPKMTSSQWGRIVLVASSGIVAPISGLALSNIGRAATAAYIKTVANELAPHGITANVVIPGRIATGRVAELDLAQAKREGSTAQQVSEASRKRIPAGRYGEPAEIAAPITFLCSGRASYITGSQLRCDGGYIASY